jgi:hypothetical protein
MSAIVSTTDVLIEMPDPSERELQEHEEVTSSWIPFIGGLAFSFVLYIIMLVLTFVIANKTKALGIILIVIGFIATVITNFWGIIPFALLLPAGIVALRYKPILSRSRKYDEDR